jgi:hypothetical protein
MSDYRVVALGRAERDTWRVQRLEREHDERPERRAPAAHRPPANAVLALQRSIGNRAVRQLLARDPNVCVDMPQLCLPPPAKNQCVVGEPDTPTPPMPTTVLAPVAPTTGPVVADVAIPVSFTEVVDDRKVKELTPDGDFTGIAELKRFAGALADEYLSRQRAETAYGKATRAKIAAKLLKALQDKASADAGAKYDAELPEGAKADKKARDAAMKAAVKAAVAPADAAVDASLVTARDDQVKAFAESWDAHIKSPQAPNLTVSTLTNAWMRNRQEEMLVVTETLKRAAGQFNMWSRDAIPGLVGFPEHLDEDETAHSLSEAPGGQDGGKLGHVHEATIKFLTALKKRAPTATFATYHNHGSWPLMGRGLSVDCYIGAPATSRQFWERPKVAEFLDAIEETAKELDYRYFAIYNDFAVEKYVNEKATYGSAGFAGGLDRGKSLNYHGGGLKLHVHLDLVPPEMRTAPPEPPKTP